MDDYRTKRRYRQQKLTKQGFYERRQQQSRARRRAEQGAAGIELSAKHVFNPENLIDVYESLSSHGGSAPGPDGITYDDLGKREVGEIMRQVSQELLQGTFEPSKARTLRIPKASGKGYRTLMLRSIIYRVVATALANALGPYFDSTFLPGSHGFRPGLGTTSMLLHMEQIIIEQQRFVIAQDDIRNAFDNVSIALVMKLLGDHIDDPLLLSVCEKILQGNQAESRTMGIDQGSALSPLMLNVALHHTLDLPFSDNAAHPSWLRYADNIVYLCQSEHEGTTAIQAAQDHLRSIGMTLKGTDGPPVDLRKGQKANILGFSIRWDNGQLHYELTKETWTNLKSKLSEPHTHSTPNAAYQVVKGWLDACGPAFVGKRETPILDKVLKAAAKAGHRELSLHQLKRYLQSSRDRWAYHRSNAFNVLKGIQEQEGEGAPLTPDRPGISTCPRPGSSQAQPAAASALLLLGEIGQSAGDVPSH